MSDAFRTVYVFELQVDGKAAKAQAENYRKEIDAILTGAASKNMDAATKKAATTAASTDAALKTLRGTVDNLSTTLNSGAIAWNNYTAQMKNAGTAAKAAVESVSRATNRTGDSGLNAFRDQRAMSAMHQQAALRSATLTPGQSVDPLMMSSNKAVQLSAFQDSAAIAQQRANAMRAAAASSVSMNREPIRQIERTNTLLSMQGDIVTKASSYWQVFSKTAQETSRELWVFRRMSYDVEKFGRSMMVAGLAAGTALYGMSDAYTTFDESATRAAMAMRLTSELSGVLRENIKNTAIETMKFSPDQIAEGLRLWAAGTGEVIRSEDQLNRMMGDTVEIQKLAAINNVEFAQTVDDVGGIMHEFGLQTEDVGRITSVLNFVAAESFANVNDLGQAFKMVGPLASELGISFETTATALAMLADNNIKGTMSGRATRQLLLSMLDPTAKTAKSLNTLFNVNESLGESWRDLIFPNEKFVGLAEMFDILAASTENMTGAQKAELAAVLENANAVPAFVTFLSNLNEGRKYGINVMRAYEKVMTGVMDAEVFAYKRMYEETTKLPFSLEGAMAKMTNMWTEYAESDAARMLKLQQRWRVAMIDMGEPITEIILPLLENWFVSLEKIVKYIEAHPDLLKLSGGGASAALFAGVALTLVGRLMNLAYTYKTVQPAFAAARANRMIHPAGGWLVPEASAAASQAGAANAAASITKIGAAIPAADLSVTGISSIISTIGSGVALAALVGVVAAVVARLATTKTRAETQATLAEQPAEMQAKFAEMFKESGLGLNLMAKTQEAENAVRNLRAAGELTAWKDQSFLGRLDQFYSQQTSAKGKNRWDVAISFSQPDLAKILAFLADQPVRIELANPNVAGDFLSGRQMRTQEYIEATNAAPVADYTDDQKAEAVAFYQHQESRRQMVSDFAEKRKQIETDYSNWVVNAEANLTKSLASLYADFTKDRARSAEDLEGGIAEATESAYKQSEDAAQNHYESLRNMQIAHAQRMVDLLESRDVQGITKEMRSYETQVDQQNRSYGQQQAKSAADLEDRIAKMKEDARKKDLQAEEDYNVKVAELRANFAEDMAARNAEKAAAQQELTAEQTKSLQELDTAFYEEIHGLEELLTTQYDTLLADLDTFTQNYVGKWRTAAEQVAMIVAMLEAGSYEASSRSGGAYLGEGITPPNYAASSGGRAAGGYVTSGMYQMHNNEFVLSADTTRGLEGRYGHLSQQTFGDSMGQQTFVFSPTFYGMGAQDKDWYRKTAGDVFDQKMSQLRGRVRA